MRKAIVLHNAIALWLISFGVTKLKKKKEKKIHIMQNQHNDCHKPGHLFLSVAAHTFAFATTKDNT